METNFFSAVALTKAVLPGMLERRAGHIIVINRYLLHIPAACWLIIRQPSFVCTIHQHNCLVVLVHLQQLRLTLLYDSSLSHSVQGKFGLPYRTAYSASKHALTGYFDALRAEVAFADIGITMVFPGYINTNLSVSALKGQCSQLT
jgi:short-subunit dehydrogenase